MIGEVLAEELTLPFAKPGEEGIVDGMVGWSEVVKALDVVRQKRMDGVWRVRTWAWRTQ